MTTRRRDAGDRTNRRDRDSLQAKLFRSHLGVVFLALLILIVPATIVGFLVSNTTPREGEPAKGLLLIIMITGLASAGLAASIMARTAARKINEPIQAIADATRRLAQGNYAVRVPLGDSTEIAKLAHDVNTLAAELEDTETRRLQLISDVAHELRTPLQTIEGSMEALMDGVVEPTDEVFAAIADEAARLKRLAFDLSTLSRAQEGPQRIERRPVELAAQVGEVVDLLRHQFDPQGVQLRVTIDQPLTISADADRVAQILTNVIGNALAYTDEGGTVSVRVLSDGPWAVVRVTDTGRGISPADLDHIFERFFRIEDRSSSGTGVGLTIARSLARAHGGDITASSPGLGQGSVFEVRLPVG